MLVLYTDGVTEAQNRKSEEYGRDRLARAVKETKPSVRAFDRTVHKEVIEWTDGRGATDDVTFF